MGMLEPFTGASCTSQVREQRTKTDRGIFTVLKSMCTDLFGCIFAF